MNWRKGPPPSIGWWPASACRNSNCLRWWNGKWWSIAVPQEFKAESAARNAAIKSSLEGDIEWTDRPAWWPERSKT